MDFRIIDYKTFRVGIDYYARIYSARDLKGLVTIDNILTGGVLFKNIPFDSITVNGEKINSINQLTDVLYNYNCVCEYRHEPGEVDEMKIFDLSFDDTFE
ncbi:hypothetical protein SAMN05443429_11222 [Cruoricaptor ignavus]|uniref:Uncharacterized protein n=1 Tax=Cruoricaptor ignavus TaxID=1118202 RepID=A0A1M6HDB9_9FLAO|nr:hypothetical protein [Cruoricaptor ignavus]SHJ20171.1 hypothetical protein SAMN05443429_11222 [Cruoricaptor ignavus]